MKSNGKRTRTTHRSSAEPRRPLDSDRGRVARRGATVVVEESRSGRRGSSGSAADEG